jgi:hypothetical protein
MKKKPTTLDREIREALAGEASHGPAPAPAGSNRRLFAVEIDPSEFDRGRELPAAARWREDLVHLAEAELGRGPTFRRPRGARYAVVEWTGYLGALGELIEHLDETPGVTRYAEISA